MFFTLHHTVCLIALNLEACIVSLLIHKTYIFCVIFPAQGGAISILTACERPSDFAGVVLIAPMVQMNPDSATPFKVQYHLNSQDSLSTLFLTFALSSLFCFSPP